MEVLHSPTPWLSEMSMEDPNLVNHLSSLSAPASEHLATLMGWQSHGSNEGANFGGGIGGSLSRPQLGDRQKSDLTVEDYLCFEQRPAKIQRVSTSDWQQQQCHGFSRTTIPPVYIHGSKSNGNYGQFRQKKLDHHVLGSYLPMLQDEVGYDAVAPQTPTIQVEVGGSPGSVVQENSFLDYRLMDTLSSASVEKLGRIKQEVPAATAAAPKPSPVQGKTSGHTLDHIMAERKRREKLSQRFIALSAIVPGLKKMDKASVLGDAIKYVKQLQERLKSLEEHASSRGAQSLAYCKKAVPVHGKQEDKFGSVSDDDFCPPEIEARYMGKNVLVRVHCEKRKGLLVKCLGELEKLNLLVMNASALSFSNTVCDFTFTAQMEEEFNLAPEELVRALQDFLKTVSL